MTVSSYSVQFGGAGDECTLPDRAPKGSLPRCLAVVKAADAYGRQVAFPQGNEFYHSLAPAPVKG